MATPNPSLDTLANVLNEFFSVSTNAERRTQLQSILNDFQNSNNACDVALECLGSAIKNPNLILFCLGILETTVVQKWPLLQSSCKQKIYSFIITSLENQIDDNDPDDANQNLNFMIKKIAKILAIIACFNWPTEFPNYFDLIKSLILNPLSDLKKSTTGLICLQSGYEQLTNPPELIDYSRKLELTKLLGDQSLQTMEILSTLVSQLCNMNLLHLTKTLLSNPSFGIDNHQEWSTSLWDPLFEFLEQLIVDCISKKGLKSYGLINLLNCLTELIKCAVNQIDLNDTLVILFIFSLVGTPQCLSICLKFDQSLVLANHKCGSYLKQISLLSLTCLQDLIEQKDLRSAGSIDCLLMVFRTISCHLALITGSIVPRRFNTATSTTTPVISTTTTTTATTGFMTSQRLCSADIADTLTMDAQKQSNHGDYLLKIVDILRCLMPHICHLDGYNLFNFKSFLHLVYDLTFSIKDLDIYFNYLQTWSQFFESVRVKYSTPNQISSQNQNEHQSVVLLPEYLQSLLFVFGESLLGKLFYTENANFLDSLDEDVLDDFINCSSIPEMSYITNSTTNMSLVFSSNMQNFQEQSESTKPSDDPCEYRLFLRESLITFHNLADLIPSYFINLVFERFQSTWTDYMSFINSTGLLTLGNFTVPKHQPLHRMHWILRDYATCLQIIGFLSDILWFLNSSMTGRDLLQVLMQSLQINVIILPILPAIEERLIKYSLIEVIVQTLLMLHALIVSGRLSCSSENQTHQPTIPDKIILTIEERDSFITQLFIILERFLLSLDDSALCLTSNSCSLSTLISPRIRLSAGLLFKSLVTSSQRDLCPSANLILSYPNGHKSNTSASNTFYRIFNAVCKSEVDINSDFQVLRLLLCALICYLSLNQEDPDLTTDKTKPETTSVPTRKSDLLSQLISSFFLPYLSLDYFTNNQVNHFVYLGLLNDAILSLENATSSTRQTLLVVLTNSGLVDKLIGCLIHILTKSNFATLVQTKCCTVYLTFFTTFIRILSYSDSVMSNIAQLFGQIIRTLRSATTTAPISSNCPDLLPLQLVEHLLDMLILISQNRRIFISLLPDIIDLCCFSFLPTLASLPGAYYKDDQSLISLLVCNACMNNPSVSQHFYEILFSCLSNGFSFFFTQNPGSDLLVPIEKRYSSKQPQVFHRILLLILATLHPEQVSSQIVRFSIENLTNLNRLRKLFLIPEFNQTWLPQFMCCLLDYLLDGKHMSCKDTLLGGLHQLSLSFTCWQSNTNSDLDADQRFVQLFLPVYLGRLDRLDNSQRTTLLTIFTNPDLTGSYKQKQINGRSVQIPNLEDLETFSFRIEQFVSGVRFFRKVNAEFNSAVDSTNPTTLVPITAP